MFIIQSGFDLLSSDLFFLFFFFNDTATTEIYTLSLHDALPISRASGQCWPQEPPPDPGCRINRGSDHPADRSCDARQPRAFRFRSCIYPAMPADQCERTLDAAGTAADRYSCGEERVD